MKRHPVTFSLMAVEGNDHVSLRVKHHPQNRVVQVYLEPDEEIVGWWHPRDWSWALLERMGRKQPDVRALGAWMERCVLMGLTPADELDDLDSRPPPCVGELFPTLEIPAVEIALWDVALTAAEVISRRVPNVSPPVSPQQRVTLLSLLP